MDKMKPILIPLATIALAACSGGEPADKAATPTALVTLAPVAAGSVQSNVRIYGTADAGASGTIILSAPEEAIVSSIDTPVGSVVGRGQVVARLSPGPTARLEFARAAADARGAQLALARAQRLRGDGLVGNAEVETARTAASSASATLASLSLRAAGLALRSPAPGHVSAISASLGALIPAGTPVASIRVLPSGGGGAFNVSILSVDPSVDPTTRLASVFAQLPASANIGAGEPLTGEIGMSSPAGAPTIPYAALLDEGGQAYVYVVVGGVAHRRDIAVGPSDGQHIVVLSGLRAGEIVVVEGGTAVEDGMRVRTR
jgi:multidrug efflux pump subunit AcrA (membrane-fusion protein)